MKHPNQEIDSCIVTIAESLSDELSLLPESVRPPGMKTLSAWFHCFAELQHVSGTIVDNFQSAAEAIIRPGGLDGASLILNSKGSNESIDPNARLFRATKDGEPAVEIRDDLLERVFMENRTLFHSATLLNNATVQRLPGMVTAVVAPIRGENPATVIGYLYGWRIQKDAKSRFGIRDLEAHFARLVAQTVTNIIVRKQNETEIADQNALLAQAFSPEVIELWRKNSSLFEGQERNVTTMFVDLRGFSAISSRLPARQTYLLVNEVMDCWTEIVMEHSGAVVDYFGDGLVAVWNAPLEVPNHAALSIECAYRIQERLPELNQLWEPIVGCPLDAGVGISTGLAHVGNCGSKHRVKYGPHGAIVNLAARLEKLTKQYCIPVLISEETAQAASDQWTCRRLLPGNVRGFDKPVEVYQPLLEGRFDGDKLDEYHTLLAAFDEGLNVPLADRISDLLATGPNDPAYRLLQNAVLKSRSGKVDEHVESRKSDGSVHAED